VAVHKFVIPGGLMAMNEYIDIARRSVRGGWVSSVKREMEVKAMDAIRMDLPGLQLRSPVAIIYRWFYKGKSEKRKIHDKHNISDMGHKFINDALVKCEVLKDDGWDDIAWAWDEWYINPKNPRIEVILITAAAEVKNYLICAAETIGEIPLCDDGVACAPGETVTVFKHDACLEDILSLTDFTMEDFKNGRARIRR
jgi:hypothetical protein